MSYFKKIFSLIIFFMFSGCGNSESDSDQMWIIPRTGQINCYDNSDKIECPAFPCTKSSGSYCGQDAQYSSDKISTFAVTDKKGDVLVTDTLNGLVWQQSYQDKVTFKDALKYCESLKEGGFDDWRIPNVVELSSIIDYGKLRPAIDTLFNVDSFEGGLFWAASIISDKKVWKVNFNGGTISSDSSTSSFPLSVRCVRGDKRFKTDKERFIVSGKDDEFTVLDTSSGLVWEKKDSFKKWETALTYCESLTLNGYSNWRLPNIKELQSIINYNSAEDGEIFPDIVRYFFWSSTTVTEQESTAFGIFPKSGQTLSLGKNVSHRVICVNNQQ